MDFSMRLPRSSWMMALAAAAGLAATVLWSRSQGGAAQQEQTAPGAAAGMISPDEGDSDYAAACGSPDGSAWAVWQTYAKGGDRIQAARYGEGRWTLVNGPDVSGDFYKPACAVDGKGVLRVVWARQEKGDWDLWGSSYADGSWSPARRLFARPGTDFPPVLAAAPDGSLVMAWQAWRRESFDILFSRHTGGAWSEPQVVTESPANDWAPSITVTPSGIVAVSWDSYRNGDYDVFLRRCVGNEWGPEIPVAAGNRFEGYPSVAADSSGNIWIAYEERGERWGKDAGQAVSAAFDELDTLLGFCRVRVRCFRENRILEPPQPPPMPSKPYDWGGDHSPHIVAGTGGRIWLVYRRPAIDQPGWGEKAHDGGKATRRAGDRTMIPLALWWNNYATWLGRDGWSRAASFRDTGSRVDSDVAAVPLPSGGLLGVWHSDSRRIQKSGMPFGMPTSNRIFAGEIAAPGEPAETPVLAAAAVAAPLPEHEIARERAAVARARSYTFASNGKSYRLFRGDLHRHTDISWDGASDASITDLFRYALDAASLDFVAPTDHNSPPGPDIEYVLWRTQKIVDLFNAPPRFIALFGYERGLPAPWGHRNIIEAKRGFPTFPRTTTGAKRGIAPDDTRQLFEYVRNTGGITIPHEIGEVGTAWTDRDPAVEPVAEIYQGCRTSYEYEGAPRSDARLKPRFNYYPAGFLWEAWKKGFRLGVIASSDHQSTHVSFANVYAPEASRTALVEAIRQRHTFGSTDNIVLDFQSAGHLQGDEFEASKAPAFTIRVRGTAPIRELVIVRNFQFVFTTGSESASISLDWQDQQPAPGLNVYYVRVLQGDGELAWSSPVWVNLPPGAPAVQ